MTAIHDFYAAHKQLLDVSAVATALIWVALLVAVPLAIGTLPEDYFAAEEVFDASDRPAGWMTLGRFLLAAVRNVCACFLMILGTVFLQGVSVVLLGFIVADFRGKTRLVRRFAKVKFVWKSICAIRRWMRKPPMLEPVVDATRGAPR